METIKSHHGFIYHGDREGWGIALIYSLNDPASTLIINQSNKYYIMHTLTTAGCVEGEDFAVEFFGGAFGDIDCLLVRPNSDAWIIAEKLRKDMEEYPVLDEDLYSEVEWDWRQETLADFARSTYPSLNDYTLAGCILQEDKNMSIGLDCWPNKDNSEHRKILAKAIWRCRQEQ